MYERGIWWYDKKNTEVASREILQICSNHTNLLHGLTPDMGWHPTRDDTRACDMTPLWGWGDHVGNAPVRANGNSPLFINILPLYHDPVRAHNRS